MLFLSISVERSQQLLKTKTSRQYLKGRRRDANERDRGYMAAVAREYERYCRREANAYLIHCERAGQLLTIDEIHETIWTQLQPLLAKG